MPYTHHIFCCTNQREPGAKRGCCADKNAIKLRDYFKARAKELGVPNHRVNTAGCLDRCEEGPVMVIYPEGIWYRYDTKDDIDEIIKTHLLGGKIVDRLCLANRPASGV
jgi:(2Fe-2S) ferredoxin